MIKNKFCYVLGLCVFSLASLLSLFPTSNASALDLSQSVSLVQSTANTRMICKGTGKSSASTFNSNVCFFGPNASPINTNGLSYIATSNVPLVAGDLYEIQMTLGIIQDVGGVPLTWNLITNSDFTILSTSISDSSYNGTSFVQVIDIVFRSNVTKTGPIVLGSTTNSTNVVFLTGGSTTVDVKIPSITQYHPYNASGNGSDNSEVLAAIADLKATQSQENNDANNRYNDEKNTTSTNANSGSSLWNRTWNLAFTNPFTGLFDLFSSSNCYDISTLSRFIGAKNAQYCSWFPASVRNVLTPAFNLFSYFLYGFFCISWLKSRGL